MVVFTWRPTTWIFTNRGGGPAFLVDPESNAKRFQYSTFTKAFRLLTASDGAIPLTLVKSRLTPQATVAANSTSLLPIAFEVRTDQINRRFPIRHHQARDRQHGHIRTVIQRHPLDSLLAHRVQQTPLLVLQLHHQNAVRERVRVPNQPTVLLFKSPSAFSKLYRRRLFSACTS